METWRKEFYASDYGSEYLMHHGIKGQRWGIRRFQNEDGTLTKEGKARYGKRYLTESAARTDISKLVREDFPERTSELSSNLKKIADEGDALSKDYEKYYNSIDSDPSFIKAVRDRKKEYISQGFDEKYAEEDAISELIGESIPKELKEKRQRFDDSIDAGWKDIEKYTNDMINVYSSALEKATVAESGKYSFFGGNKYSKLGEETIKAGILGAEGDIQWHSYMSSHYDDYWVNDLDSRYSLESRISKKLKEYDASEKRMAPLVKKAEEYAKSHPGTPMSVDYNAGTIRIGPDTFKVG